MNEEYNSWAIKRIDHVIPQPIKTWIEYDKENAKFCEMIGAVLYALPAGESNKTRKIIGDLFEHHSKLILQNIGIPVHDGVVSVPVIVDDNLWNNFPTAIIIS